MSEPAIFFGTPPNLNDLCCISVEVASTYKESHPSLMQPQIIKCREIIFTEYDVLASPAFKINSTFNVVLKQSYFKTGRLQTRLQKQGMKFSKPCRVVSSLYQECLQYTLTAKLAPAWNRVGDWFIQGRDFLLHEGYSNAIKMELFVNKDETIMSLYGTAIRFPPLTLKDLELSQAEIQALVKSTEEDIQQISINERWCHVLPSMKKGKISSLSITIPKESPFTCYQVLKRYWKNMYGYRLPETDDEILYCQIGFSTNGRGKLFTCSEVQIVPRIDSKPILTTFLQDLHIKMPQACGASFSIQPKIYYAKSTLHNAGEKNESVNLTSRPKVTVPVRPVNKLYFSKSQNASTQILDQNQDLNIKEKNANSLKVKKLMEPCPYFNAPSTKPNSQLSENVNDSPIPKAKILPIFWPKQKSTVVTQEPSESSCPKISRKVTEKVVTNTLFSTAKSLPQVTSSQPLFNNYTNKVVSTIPPSPSKLVLSKTKLQIISSQDNSQTSAVNIKRKQKAGDDSTAKKPRKKSEVQNLDVDSLARVNQLNKVNTVTLTAWLKDRGIVCKAKDKKSDLVEKVNRYLQVSANEQ